jgi:hypothetical protein
MASISRIGKRWRAQVFVRGVRASQVFDTKAQASAWALEQQAELAGDKLPDKTFGEALERYGREVAPQHRGYVWELRRLGAMGRHRLAGKRLALIVGSDIADWRDDRLRSVAPASVLREMKLMRSVFESCRRDFGWLRENPMRDVTRPTAPPSRKRRITADEIERLKLAFGLGEQMAADTATQRVGLAFLLALETAMRAGELLGLHWRDVDLVERASLEDLHFHDSRAEAIWRLSKKLDVLQLARVIGHRDLKSLLIFYDVSASELAKRLG